MSLCDFITSDQLALLKARLADAGFVPPHDWLEGRLQAIHFDLERHKWQRDKAGMEEAIGNWSEACAALRYAQRIVRHWEGDLIAERLSADVDMVAGDAWNYKEQEPITKEALSALMVPPEFAPEEIETCRRVLAAALKNSERVQNYHGSTFDTRPIKKARPEVKTAIAGLVRIWCQATGIDESEIVISASDHNEAMRFIEPGVEILLGQSMMRETIDKKVVAIRDEHRAQRMNV